MQVPPTAASGTWTVNFSEVRDQAGNYASIQSPVAPLPNGSFTVVGSSDTTPPMLQSLTVSPATVNAGDTVTITARVTDAESGVVSIFLSYRLPNGQSAPVGPNFFLVSGSPQDGIWRASMQVPPAAAPGNWTVSFSEVRDQAGNYASLQSPIQPLPNGSFTVTLRCTPRPRVAVTVGRAADGRIPVTLTAGAGSISQVQLGTTSRPLSNAEVDVVGVATGITSGRVIDLPSNTSQLTLFVKQQSPDLAATVPMIVTDGCGPWQTFVGGGPTAFR
jgi:hypothetical protein